MEDRLLTLRLEDFEQLRGETFTFRAAADAVLSTRLDHVRGLGGDTVAGTPRGPFALIFTTETRGVLPQQTVRVENELLGELEIFVVPVGPDANGRMQYEAIFT
jgi:Domain of unknown function (DUF6916)